MKDQVLRTCQSLFDYDLVLVFHPNSYGKLIHFLAFSDFKNDWLAVARSNGISGHADDGLTRIQRSRPLLFWLNKSSLGRHLRLKIFVFIQNRDLHSDRGLGAVSSRDHLPQHRILVTVRKGLN